MNAIQKVCCACGTDVANAKRVKDSRGQYYCQPCYEKTAQRATAPKTSVAHPVPVAAMAGPADNGEIDLAEPIKAPVQEDLFGCSSCKKLVGKRQIRNEDGEFLCVPCLNKRRSPANAAAKKTAKSTARQSIPEDNIQTDGALPFVHTLHGGILLSAAILVFSYALFFTLSMAFPPVTHQPFAGPTVLFSAVLAFIESVFIVFRAVILVASMLITARILGGCDFGFIGSVLWKSLTAALVFSILNFFIERADSLMMLGLMIRGLVFLVTFALLFRLDYFESMLLSVINFFLFWALAIALAVVLFKVRAALSHAHEEETLNNRAAPCPWVQPELAAGQWRCSSSSSAASS